MAYLIAKMALMLLLAAMMGVLLARWWLRRNYLDVTEEHTRLTALARSPATVDHASRFEALGARLGDLEATMHKVLAHIENPPAPPAQPSRGAQLLESASYGVKDDLKRISGVGPVLEDLLNRIGVYYFWQVASWNNDDVQEVDDLLESFKGRITRDEWVPQATILMQNPSADRPPEGHSAPSAEPSSRPSSETPGAEDAEAPGAKDSETPDQGAQNP